MDRSYEEFWDKISSIEEEDFDDEKINRLLRWKDINENLCGVRTILDIGAATGAFSIPLSKMGYDVTHFDLSQDMIDKAKDKSQGIGNIKFIKGNAIDLSLFKEDEFDLVLCFDGAISFSGKNSNKVIKESCRVGKKLMLTVSSKSCMVATWLNYSLSKFGRIHPSVKDMMVAGYFNKANYDDVSELTSIDEIKAYDIKELYDILISYNMRVIECRSLGSLTHLYLLHLYRQYSTKEVNEKINEISLDSEFVELCDYYDKEVMNSGMGSFRRAGIIAIAEKINDNSIEKSK
ncbi:class I SAM-dependent methyltransferase [Clostridium sp. 1001283B150210_160208_E6]|uniref:methyltransferase domain-containing protein n=1 Tax=Clostridium sp. 1001283B150210_160208_E6 TaxID=2787129 RepID=UPI0018ABB801